MQNINKHATPVSFAEVLKENKIMVLKRQTAVELDKTDVSQWAAPERVKYCTVWSGIIFLLLPFLFLGEELNGVWCGPLWWCAQGMGASREEGRDMAGLHPSKGCRGQTFSCPWPRTPGGAGLMAARSKRLTLPGQKPAPSWKMWIVELLCLGPGAMRSEKTDLCRELDCVWTLSLSRPVGRTDGADNSEV